MWLRWLAVCVAALLCSHAFAGSATGNRVLVFAEEPSAYEGWVSSLSARGYSVGVQDASTELEHAIYENGERAFDHIALLAPAMKEFPAGLRPQQLVSFLQDGGNMLVALSSELSEAWRAFAREFDLEFAQRETLLVDHFGYDKSIDTGNHAAVQLGGASPYFARGGPLDVPVFREETRAAVNATPFVYRGVAHWLGPNPLAFSAIAPPLSAYETDVPQVSGAPGRWTAEGIDAIEPLYEARAPLVGADVYSSDATASLASALQLRDNSARATFIGSTEVFAGLYKGDVQCKVIDELVGWTFQERGVLRVERTAHERIAADEADVRPEYEEEPGAAHMYRIKDNVRFSIDLAAFEDEWKAAPRDLDLQVSVVMLDAYVTEPLVATTETVDGERPVTRYEATIQLPDRHGVFSFKVNWKRHGLTYVVTSDTAPVRPFNHDEYPRMLSSSWPYVAGAFSTMAAFVAFVALWLSMPSPSGAKSKSA
ncbi:oligosaccharyl transferase glycoprotein complex, beta subunit [Malassezia cuniculi]|uniref:Dolichyl-diphosphooligosaccharide--protein glycosyltransferase subunit WBP1 n=1 Tax=Malassezia cuniculi TaxID=948313 RepID=A0AAF0J484_9BASI|nr:oligosaccharyl transferase glycoprotein complex, beta subunit [Malassezia cuniculi]